MAQKTIDRLKTTSELADTTLAQRLKAADSAYREAKAVADRLEKERKVLLDEAVARGLDCVERGSKTFTAKGTLLALTQAIGGLHPVSFRISEAIAKSLEPNLYSESQSWKVIQN